MSAPIICTAKIDVPQGVEKMLGFTHHAIVKYPNGNVDTFGFRSQASASRFANAKVKSGECVREGGRA